MKGGRVVSVNRAPRRLRTIAGRGEKTVGSFCEARDTGNSNRVLGLFRDLAKGVK